MLPYTEKRGKYTIEVHSVKGDYGVTYYITEPTEEEALIDQDAFFEWGFADRDSALRFVYKFIGDKL